MGSQEAKMNLFYPDTHTYFIAGRKVPSVTQVLGDILPSWKASEWYLQRGRAVHACAAMIGRGKNFKHDPQLSGQVAACRRFFSEVKPRASRIEEQLFSEKYQYAGTVDMVCGIGGKVVVLDYKATLTESLPIQCAAYALAIGTANDMWGVGVELRDDGTYKMSTMYRLKLFTQEWLALLTAYNVRQRLGVKGDV